jgi:hypothetical protein
MQLAEVSIRRPVLATVLSVREYPKIDEPVVTVETRYTGASSEVIEAQVTKVLEDSLAGIEGVDVISSISRRSKARSPCVSFCRVRPIQPLPTCATRSAACASACHRALTNR